MFAIVLGLLQLASGWSLASDVWGLPFQISNALKISGLAVWGLLLALYGLKWLFARKAALEEIRHPVQCCFPALIGVSTMLAGMVLLPLSYGFGTALIALGGSATLAFAIWRTGGLWQGGRDPEHNTPVLYLPTVAGAFVGAIAVTAAGFPTLGNLAFGVGLFSWLAIESVLLHRLYGVTPMARAIRPTLGIQIAPAGAGAIAFMATAPDPSPEVVYAFLGYGLFQAFVLLRLSDWLSQPSFTPAFWSFSFGAASLGAVPLWLVADGDTGLASVIAPWTFAAANIVIAILVLGTLRLVLRGRLVDQWMIIPWPTPLLSRRRT